MANPLLAKEAGDLLVWLSSIDLAEDAVLTSWKNYGTLADFSTIEGTPNSHSASGSRVVEFDGASAVVGPTSPAALCGNNPRTIEVWLEVHSPSASIAVADQGGLVSWSNRAAGSGQHLALECCHYSAVHDTPDLTWSSTPVVEDEVLALLTYTFDGSTVRLYKDGVEDHTQGGVTLNTACSDPMVIGRETPNGDPNTQFFSGYISTVRVHSDALSAADVLFNFNLGPDPLAAQCFNDVQDGDEMAVDYGGICTHNTSRLPLVDSSDDAGVFFKCHRGLDGCEDAAVAQEVNVKGVSGLLTISIIMAAAMQNRVDEVQLLMDNGSTKPDSCHGVPLLNDALRLTCTGSL